MDLSDEQLATAPRWDPARLAEVPGRVRGDLLGPWGRNLTARFGADALGRVRRRLAAPLDALAPVLTARDWLPAHAQVAITEAIVDEYLGGDLRALYPLLVADTRASLSRVHLLLARSFGAARAFKLSPKIVSKVYEVGRAEVVVDGRRARVTYAGNRLFSHPSWRLLQLHAMRMLLELAGTPGAAIGEAGTDDGFTAVATW